MKRIISFMLCFVMLFSTMGSPVYATSDEQVEIIQDEVVAEQQAEVTDSDEIDVNNLTLYITVDGETYTHTEAQTTPVEITSGASYTVTAKDANGTVISDQDYFSGYTYGYSDNGENLGSGGLTSLGWTDPSLAGYLFTLPKDQQSGVYPMTIQMGTFETGFVKYSYNLKVVQPDGVWLGTYMGACQRYDGEAFELEANDELYFYVVSEGQRIAATQISVAQDPADSAKITVYDENGGWYPHIAIFEYNGTPTAGTVYHYTITADGTTWDFSVTLPWPDDVIYFNVNNTGWQQYAPHSIKYFEPYDIVQLYVEHRYQQVPINEKTFAWEYGYYDSYSGYLENDSDGKIQTLYFTPDDINPMGFYQLQMKSLSVPGTTWTVDFKVQRVTKELGTAEGFEFGYSENNKDFRSYNQGEIVKLKPGDRIYLQLTDEDGNMITGEKAAIFSAVDDWDKIHITYDVDEGWCINVDSRNKGYTDTIHVIYDGQVYGDFKIKVSDYLQITPIVQWKTEGNEYVNYDWEASSPEVIDVAQNDTLYIKITDQDGEIYPPSGYGLGVVSHGDTSGIWYAPNEEGVLKFVIPENAKTGSYFASVGCELGDFFIYFDIVESYNNDEPDDPSDEYFSAWFEDTHLKLPSEGRAEYEIYYDNLPEDTSIDVKLGFIDYENDEFIIFENQEGIEKCYDDNGVLYAIILDTDAITEAYPDRAEIGWLTAMIFRVNPDNSTEEIGCSGVHFPSFGGGGFSDSGIAGTVEWTFDGQTLTLSGKGNTPNYNYGDAPWSNYDREIRELIICEGVTGIGNSNFVEAYNLEVIDIQGNTLKKIGNDNFNVTRLISLVLNEGLTNIGDYCFGYSPIEEIVLPSTLVSIGRECFAGVNIEEIYLPKKLTKIGSGIFFGSSLEKYTVDATNTAYSAVDGVLYDKAGTKLISVPSAIWVENGEYTVSSKVKTIGEMAFRENKFIEKLIIPDHVTAIEGYAFWFMYELKEVVLGNGVKNIPTYGFADNHNLKTITIGKNVTAIQPVAFRDCPLEEVIFDGDKPAFKFEQGMIITSDGKKVHTITPNAVIPKAGSEDGYIVVPYGVEVIGEGAGGWLLHVEGVELPATVKTIEADAFCLSGNSFTKIIIPSTVTSIGTDAFTGSGIQDGGWELNDDGQWVCVAEGTVYYGGSEAQWNKIKANINPQKVVFGYHSTGELKEVSAEMRDEDRLVLEYYGEPIKEELEIFVDTNENPVTGEAASKTNALLTWDTDQYGENFSAEYIDDTKVEISINAPGTYEFTAYNEKNPEKDQLKYKYVIKDMADDVEFAAPSGNYTRDGKYILQAGKTLTTKLNWIDGTAWNASEYSYTINGSDELKDYVEVTNTGVVKVAKNAPAGHITLDFTATAKDNTYEINDQLEIQIVNNLATGVTIVNGNPGQMNGSSIGSKVILDPVQGITSFVIKACVKNEDASYGEVAFTSSASENFTVVDNGDNTATITLTGGTGSVTVTATAMDGSKKSAKVTVAAGTAVEELHIEHTMAVKATETVEGIETDVVVLAKGKTATLKAGIIPSAAANKEVMWISSSEEVVKVQNGKLTTLAEGDAYIMALAQDGSGCADMIHVKVIEPAKEIEITSNLEDCTDRLGTVKAGKGTLTIGSEPGSVTLTAVPVNASLESENVYEEVEWSISGGIAKYVTYDIKPVEYNGSEVVTPAQATFYADRQGSFTVKATTLDGSKVVANYAITVVQVPYAMDVTNISGSKGTYTTGDGLNAFIIKGDFTKKAAVIKPTVVFNNSDKQDAVKAPNNAYDIYVNDVRDEDGKLEIKEKGIYTVKFAAKAKAAAMDAAAETTFVIDARDNASIDIDAVEIAVQDTVVGNKLAEGVKVQLTAMLNGSKSINSKAAAEWKIERVDGVEVNATISTKGQLDLKNANCGEEYRVTLTIAEKENRENAKSTYFDFEVVDPMPKTVGDIRFGNQSGLDITVMGKDLNPTAGNLENMSVIFSEGIQGTDNFTVVSGNKAVLNVEQVGENLFTVTPLKAGKVTLTIKAMDGSKNTVKLNAVVAGAESPVNKITAAGTAYTVSANQSIAVAYGLESKVSKPGSPVSPVTSTAMSWVSSDERIAKVENLGITDTVSVTAANGNVTHTAKGSIVITTGALAGKATITGSALDGSGKTVKINVTVAAVGETQAIHLSTPAGSANGGKTDGTVVLPWGKTLKLTATVNPNNAKNKDINYTIVGVDTRGSDIETYSEAELAALGVAVKAGTVTAKNASKQLHNPYVGWVKVIARLNYSFAEYADNQWITQTVEDTQYVFIDRPVQSIKFKTTNAQGKSVNAPTGETIKSSAIGESGVSFKLTDKYEMELINKGYSETKNKVTTNYTTAESVYGTADNLLWTTNNPALATVENDGTINVNKFTKTGSVKITAAAQDGSGVKYSYTIKIVK